MSYGMTLMEQKLALDEMNKDGALTNIWCGVTPPTEIFRSKTNQMLLTFFTDNRLSGGGFEFIYEEREG